MIRWEILLNKFKNLPESGEVVREIPPEKFLKAVELLYDMKNVLHAQGIEVDVKY
jgi:hypothetical protein